MIRHKQNGYTLPELMIAISISAVIIRLILVFTINYSRFAASMQSVSDAFVTRLNVSDYFRDKLGASSGLISQNSIVDTNAGNPDTSISPYYYWKKIHAIPGTIANGSDGNITPIFYFRRFSQDSTGAYIMNGTLPYEDEYVIYLDNSDKSLNVRYLANQNATNNKLKTSCPKNLVTATCPADAKLMDNVQSVDIRYFSRSGTLIDWTSIYDSVIGAYVGPDFPAAEVVELKINTTVKAKYQSNQLNNTTIIRVAIRNT